MVNVTDPKADEPAATFPLTIRPFSAMAAATRLLINQEDTQQQFRVFDSLDGPQTEKNFQRFAATEIGRKLIRDEVDLATILCDRDGLKRMPKGSLARRYIDFTDEIMVGAMDLIEAERQANVRILNVEPARRRFISSGIQLHDIWHCLTGYGRDALGEACILEFTYGQLRTRGLATFAVLLGFRERVLWPRVPIGKCLKEARQLGKDAEWLVAQDWRDLLPMPFEEVRKKMKIGEPFIYKKYAAVIHAKDKVRIEKLKAPLEEAA
jgi:ubiquinone biosynthesis protein COQ4